jgi:hypothetical protein
MLQARSAGGAGAKSSPGKSGGELRTPLGPCLFQSLSPVDRGKSLVSPPHGVEGGCNERARGLFKGHCGCRQRFGRSILSIGTLTPHSGHLTVFVSSISMRMADAKEKAYWERPAGLRPRRYAIPLSDDRLAVGQAEGAFGKLQKLVETILPARCGPSFGVRGWGIA